MPEKRLSGIRLARLCSLLLICLFSSSEAFSQTESILAGCHPWFVLPLKFSGSPLSLEALLPGELPKPDSTHLDIIMLPDELHPNSFQFPQGQNPPQGGQNEQEEQSTGSDSPSPSEETAQQDNPEPPEEPDPNQDGGLNQNVFSDDILEIYEHIRATGSPDFDPENPWSDAVEELSDDVKKEFLRLRERVLQVKFYQLKQTLLMIRKVVAFSRKYPAYAAESYQLLERLIRYFSLAVNIAVKAGFQFSLGFSTFEDKGLATVRSLAVLTGDTLAALVPWFYPDRKWLDFLSLASGSLIIGVTDNGFAHLTNSSYALPYISNDFVNFEFRLIVLVTSEIWLLKYIYSGLLVGGVARLTHANLIPLLVVDFTLKPVLLYMAVATFFATVPVIAVTCAPNPVANYSFPFSNYCPSVPWIPWLIGCNSTAVEVRSNP